MKHLITDQANLVAAVSGIPNTAYWLKLNLLESLEKELNEANDRIQELEAYMALAKSGLRQLADKMKGRV